MTDALQNLLKQLRLSGLLSTLEVRLHKAAANHLDHREFLELILQDELAVRSDRQLQRRVKAAQFREVKALDQFDWGFNAAIPKKPIFELATCNFIRDRRDVLLLGPPGVGKSFLAQALGYHGVPGESKPASAKGALNDSKPATADGAPTVRPAKTKSLEPATSSEADSP